MASPLAKRSSSLEFIELLPASPPTSLDASAVSIEREGEPRAEGRGERREEERESSTSSSPGRRHGAAGRSPAQQSKGSHAGAASTTSRKATPFSRYSYSLKRPFERGKSLQEMFVVPTPVDYERSKSAGDLTDSLQRNDSSRFVRGRDSFRADRLNSPTSQTLWMEFVTWLNKKGLEKRDYSLFCFHKKGRTRKICKKIMKSRIFKVFMSLVAILNSLALCFYSPIPNNRNNDIIAYTSVIFIVIYVLEVALGIMAYTCVLHPKGYLRRGWSLVDLAVILFGILYVSLYSTQPLLAEVCACFMSVKLIKILSISDTDPVEAMVDDVLYVQPDFGVQFILKVLVKLAVPLFYLTIFTVLVMFFFSLVGMQLFSGTLHGGCFTSYRTPAGKTEQILVSQFPCKLEEDKIENMTQLDISLHQCPNGSSCQRWDEGPNSGLTSFDNFFVAFLTVFQVMTLEGWSGIFYLYESAVGITYAWVYFLLVVVVGSVFILNLWLGVLTSVFIGVSDREERHGNIRKLKEKKRNDDDLRNYREWLKKATELDLPSETGSIGRRPSIVGGIHWTRDESVDSDSESEDEIGSIGPPPTDASSRSIRRCWYKSKVAVRTIVKSKAFYFFDLAVHVVNLIFLMSIHFPQNPKYDLAICVINYMFSLWYITEVCLRIHIYGIKVFFTRKPTQNIVVVCLSVLSVLSLLWYIPHEFFNSFELIVIINAIWSLKLIQILRYTSYWKAMKEILNTFFQLLNQTASLIGILGVVTFIFTTIGVRLFGERLRFQEDDYPNFDNFYKSFLLVFQLLTTEDWHNVFYSYIGPYRREDTIHAGFIAIYYGAVIVVGSFILVNVFLAIAVDKLSEVRSLEEDTIEETEKMMERRKEREEQISALKDPNKPQVQRRTIRRVMRYLEDNPSERLKQLQQVEAQKKKRKRLQLDLKRGASLINPPGPGYTNDQSDDSYRRSVSAPANSDSNIPLSMKEHVPSLHSGASEPVKSSVVSQSSATSTPKRQNPLRLMKRRSDYFDKQKVRLGGWQASSASQSTRSSLTSSIASQAGASIEHRASRVQSSTLNDDDDSVFDVELPSSGKTTERHFSIMSTPESAKVRMSDLPLTGSYERTQSCPGVSTLERTTGRGHTLDVIEERDSPDIVEKELDGDLSDKRSLEMEDKRSWMRKQDTMDDDDGIVEAATGSHQMTRSFSPSNLQLPTDFMSQRLDRESSLEAIHQLPGSERRASQVALSVKMNLRRKFYQIWEWMKEYSGTMVFNPANELKEIPNHSSFFIFSPDNRLRQFCFRLVSYPSFETITYTVILLSSLLLALEIPIGVSKTSTLCSFQNSLIFLDAIIVVYFLFEMLLKIVALGLILHRGSYLRGFFNLIDCFVVISSLIPIVYYVARSSSSVPTGKCFAHLYEPGALPIEIGILRIFRVLRPFRAVRISGLYLVVTGLISSIKSMGSILLVTLLVLVIFAVIGVDIFRGRFYFCTDRSVTVEQYCQCSYFSYAYAVRSHVVPDLSCPEVKGRIWRQRDLNFAHVGNASLTLLTMVTGEGWQNVMYSGINSVPPIDSETPVGAAPYSSPEAAVYFIVYMIIMTFILLPLFIGVVIVTFQEVGVKSFRETKLDRNQRNCMYFALTAKPVPQYLPKFAFHRKVHDRLVPVINHYLFKAMIFLVLIANFLLLACQVNGDYARYEVIFYINIAFTAFFVIEALVKIIAFTPPIYFRNIWNVVEFSIEFFSILELIVVLSLENHTFDTNILSLKRTMIASTFRVLRLLRFIRQVRLILWTIFQSLEIFPWVGYLLIMVIFMFTVLGMQLFGTIKILSIDNSDESEITDYNNFSNFFRAVLVMARVTTGENWPMVMLSCLHGQRCELSDDSNCGNDFAYVFFITFYILATILILNLFVAIIIDNFDYIVRDRSLLGAHQLDTFVKNWSTFDPLATGKISPEVVIDLMRKCNPPVGWGKLCPQTVAYKKMMNLNLPLVDGKVTFNATLFALVRTSLKVTCQGCPECTTKCNVDLKKKLMILFPTMAEKQINEVLPKEDDETIGKKYAALLIQHIWRRRAARTRKVMEMFRGSEGVVRLKTGPRTIPDTGPDLVAHRTSDFAADLALPSPTLRRRTSELSSMGTSLDKDCESPPYRGPLSPASLTGFEYGGMAALSDPQSWRRGSSMTQIQQLPRLPETVEEQLDSVSEGQGSHRRVEGGRFSLVDEDLQSELSFTSAYSNPRDSTESLERMETTV